MNVYMCVYACIYVCGIHTYLVIKGAGQTITLEYEYLIFCHLNL